MMNQNTNATATKMTYVKALEVALSCEALPADVREKLSALRDQQVKRNSAEKKPTKNQQANEGLKSKVLEVLTATENPVTVSDLLTMDEAFAGMSNQKMSALVTALVDDGKAVRTTEKRKAYFTAVK